MANYSVTGPRALIDLASLLAYSSAPATRQNHDSTSISPSAIVPVANALVSPALGATHSSSVTLDRFAPNRGHPAHSDRSGGKA